MQDNQVLFEIKDLCKSFGDNLVLDHISTEIRKGEVLVIIGPSGSGKSTLMHILGLLDRPTDGVYEIYGENVLKFLVYYDAYYNTYNTCNVN